MKVKSYSKRTCNCCGRQFEIAIFDDEDEDDVSQTICLPCIFGFKDDEEFAIALAEQMKK